MGIQHNVYFIAALSVIGGGLFGFDIASMSAIIGTDQYTNYYGTLQANGQVAVDSSVQGGITAAMPGGSWVGALLSGFLTDRLGRKTAIQVACIIWVIGSIISCASVDVAMLIVGRFINGICVGIASAQVPVYISELAPPSKRGRLVGCQQWAITWGILIMFYISYGTSFLDGTKAFRIPWGLQMVPAVVLFVGLIFTPESPRWLARRGRWDDVQKVITDVHGKGDPSNPLVDYEVREIRAMVEFEKANSDVTYFDLVKPHMINRTHIACFTQIWSQLTGMNVMMYYITYVFKMAGKASTNANLLASSIQYIINVIMTIPALIYIDRWGRRAPLVIGALFMCTWMFANAGIMASYGHYAGPGGVDGKTPEASWKLSGAPATGVIACTYLFVASYAPTWGPVSWIYPPELFPMRERGKAVALSTSFNWIFNFALSYFVPPAFENIKWQVYLVFGVFNFAMAIHAFFMFPETAGKTLEETRDMFEDKNGIALIGTPAWKTHRGITRARDIEHGSTSAPAGTTFAEAQRRYSAQGSSSPDSTEKPEVVYTETAGKVA